jgi:hypothetical protein
VNLPAAVPTSVWRGQQLGTAEVLKAGSVVATVPLLAEAAVTDPAEPRIVPQPRTTPAQQPAETPWQRALRAATHSMGLFSVRLLGTPVAAQ